MPPEPSQLPLGELARFDFHQLNRLGQAAFAAQMFHHLPVADGLHRESIFRQPALQKLLRFRHQAARKHFVHADGDAMAQIVCGAGQTQNA